MFGGRAGANGKLSFLFQPFASFQVIFKYKQLIDYGATKLTKRLTNNKREKASEDLIG